MNPLTEILPAPVRKYLYALVFVVGLVLTAIQASDGNWLAAVTYLIPTLSSALAASNTAPLVDDEETYDGHATYADEVEPPEDIAG